MKLKISLFLAFLIVSLFPFINEAEAQNSVFHVELKISHDYVVQGETIGITTTTNYTGYLLQIYLPNKQLWHNQTYPANTTQSFPIPNNAPYGTYTVKTHIPNQTVTSWFTVLDISDWSSVTFPHNVFHQRIEYWFYSNWTFQARGSDGLFSIDLSMLRQLADNFNLITTPRKNSMNFRVRFTNYAAVSVDLVFAFIHKGCKLIVNGTIDQPREFTFNITKYFGTFKKLISSVKTGHLVFDWSDIPRNAFNYANQVLTVNIPETFRVDPYIFEDGFEGADNEWTGTKGAPDLNSTTYSHHGSESMEVNVTEIFETPTGAYEDLIDRNSTNLRAYFYIDHWVTAFNTRYITPIAFDTLYDDAHSSPCRYNLMILGADNQPKLQLQVYLDNNTQIKKTSTTILSMNIWLSLEVEYQYGGNSNGNITVYVDGTEDTDLTVDNQNLTRTIKSVMVGNQRGYKSEAGTEAILYVDCVVVDDAYIGVEAAGVSVTHELTETFNITDNTIIGRSRRITESETITITEVRTFGTERLFTYSEILQINDAQNIRRSLVVTNSETLQIFDVQTVSVSLVGVFFANLGTINIFDNFTFRIARFIVASESITITDVQSVAVAIRLGIVEIFESVNLLSQTQTTVGTITVTTLMDVLALASIAFIIAVCAFTYTVSKRE